MKSESQQISTALPAGRVDAAGLLYGSVGLGLAIALHWMGAYRRVDAWLSGKLREPMFGGEVAEVVGVPLLVVCAAVFCFGVGFAVLDSAGMWRKVVLGVTAMVLSLAMIFAFAVWGVYFSPFLQLVAVFWTWFCGVLYAQHHRMPCENLSSKSKTPNTKRVPASQDDEKYRPKGEVDGSGGLS